MSEATPGRELTEQQRTTLDHLTRHATTHNLAWDDVLSLLKAVADVREEHSGTYAVTIDDEKAVISKPKHDALDEQTVLHLRRILTHAGYGNGEG